MEYGNELRASLMTGDVEEGFKYLLSKWPDEKGKREVAVIGDDEQEWRYIATKRHKELEVKKVGWKQIIESTSLGRYERDDILAYAILIDGGANHVGNLVDARYIIGVYQDGKCVTLNSPIVVEDTTKKEKKLGEVRKIVTKSATDKILDILDGIKVEEKTEICVDLTNSKPSLLDS